MALRLFLMVQLPLVGVDPAPPVLLLVQAHPLVELVEWAVVLARQPLPEPLVLVPYKVAELLVSLVLAGLVGLGAIVLRLL